MRRLEEQTQKYWLLSSYWNGRIEMDGKVPSVGTFIKRLMEFLSSGASFRLVLAIGKLLDEVIEHGRKQVDTTNDSAEVIHLLFDEDPFFIESKRIIPNQAQATK